MLIRLSPAVQSVAYAMLTKSVGSGFRVRDDWFAKQDIRNRTVFREGTLLGLTTLFTAGIQKLFTQTLRGVIARRPALAAHELLLRALVTAPVMILAEATSRQFFPKLGLDKRSGAVSSSSAQGNQIQADDRKAEEVNPFHRAYVSSPPVGHSPHHQQGRHLLPGGDVAGSEPLGSSFAPVATNQPLGREKLANVSTFQGQSLLHSASRPVFMQESFR